MLSPLQHPSLPVLPSSATTQPSTFTISTPPTTPPSTTTSTESSNSSESARPLPILQRDVSFAHPVIQQLYQQLNPVQFNCVPYEALDPHEYYIQQVTNKNDTNVDEEPSDKRSETDESRKRETDRTSEPILSNVQFDDLFLLHHQWMTHRDARQPLYKDHTHWVHRLHGLEHPPNKNKTSDSASSPKSSIYSRPPPSKLQRSVRRRARGRPSPFDDLQSESNQTLSQKQRTQTQHDAAFLKDQLTHFREDYTLRCDALEQQEQALRHAWLRVLPLLRVNGAPMTPAAIRTLEWLHQHELVPQSALGCIDIGHRVCVEWNRNRALLCYGAIALQLMQLTPWFGSDAPVNGFIEDITGVGIQYNQDNQDNQEMSVCTMNTQSSSPFTLSAMNSPLWMCARFAIATQGIGWWSTRARWWRTVVNDSSWQYTLPTTVRSDVLLVSMGLWVVGAPVAACVGVGMALQGVSWWAVSRAVGVCNRMMDTDTTPTTTTPATKEGPPKKNENTKY